MIVSSTKDVGKIIKDERKSQNLTQAQLAAASGVGVRMIVDIENGKTTAQIGKVLFILTMLGIDVDIKKRKAEEAGVNEAIPLMLRMASSFDGRKEK